jgi:exopolysaccharide production protein ExoZ
MTNNRLYNLDYLRGFAALGIMVYHYCSWGLGQFHAETFLGRVGVYGVSIFYVLSGLTLYYVYYDKMKPGWKDLKDFFTKRLFRIFPLLWLTMILTILTRLPTEGFPGPYKLFISFTGLFGFIDWANYIGTGVWSIGNELVFYIFFPFFVLFAKKARWAFWILSLLLAAIYVCFAFIILDPIQNVESQKANYINPLNQVFLFLGGFLIGFIFKKIHPPNFVSLVLLIFSLVAFILIPAAGDSIHLVSGINRIVFTTICFVICFSFYKLQFRLPGIVDKALTKLGEASYSVYLIHPIVWAVLSFSSKKLISAGIPFPVELRIGICFALALVISYLIYITYEKFFIRLGKRVTEKQSA